MLPFFVHKIFTFYIKGALKLKFSALLPKRYTENRLIKTNYCVHSRNMAVLV